MSYTVKDGNGVSRTFGSFEPGGTHLSQHVPVDSSGNEILPATASAQNATQVTLDAINSAIATLITTIVAQFTTLIKGSFRTTYRISGSFTPAATATDVVTLSGSASKTVRIIRVAVSASIASAAQGQVVLVKRSTADAGGTSTTPTPVPLDSTNAAASAVARVYTANPTILGVSLGNVSFRPMLFTTSTTLPDRVIFEFGDNYKQAIVLRGANEQLAINLNGSTGTSVGYELEWTEE